jgi:uncharacterized protein (DUF849 family)
MAARTWVEVALNGPWGRSRQPGIPVRVAEIVREGMEAAHAGAAIVHFHPYDEATGRQRDDWEICARIIEGIRSRVDAIVYPTVPMSGGGEGAAAAQARFRHLDELGRRGLIEWAVVDPGSVNLARLDAVARGEAGVPYLNPEEHVREGLSLARRHGFRPSYAIYEPGFTRLGAAMAAGFPGLAAPVYRFMFSDEFAFGFPPERFGLDAHLELLRRVAPHAPWMVAGLGVELGGLIDEAAARGGHVRVGLEDAPFGTGSSNLALVGGAVRRIQAAGAEPATAAEIRARLRAIDALVTGATILRPEGGAHWLKGGAPDRA